MKSSYVNLITSLIYLFNCLYTTKAILRCMKPTIKYCNTSPRKSCNFLSMILDNSIDISPSRDAKILKQLIKRGNPIKGYPTIHDKVEIMWKIFIEDKLVHSSDNIDIDSLDPDDEDYFSFIIGAEPRQVIHGWDVAFRTMFEGEISMFTIHKDYAFGIKGAPPLILPNTTISCELELVRITPSVRSQYKDLEEGEDIKEQIVEKIRSGTTPLTEEVLEATNAREETKQMKIPIPDVKDISKTSQDLPTMESPPFNYYNSDSSNDNNKIPLVPKEASIEEQASIPNSTRKRKFFDSRYKTDPNQQVSGKADDFIWNENPRSIEVEIKLDSTGVITKEDIHVELK